jgi:hypothetical protein
MEQELCPHCLGHGMHRYATDKPSWHRDPKQGINVTDGMTPDTHHTQANMCCWRCGGHRANRSPQGALT